MIRMLDNNTGDAPGFRRWFMLLGSPIVVELILSGSDLFWLVRRNRQRAENVVR